MGLMHKNYQKMVIITLRYIELELRKDDKETILEELDLLKINQRTVYLVFENSARYIKNRLERKFQNITI